MVGSEYLRQSLGRKYFAQIDRFCFGLLNELTPAWPGSWRAFFLDIPAGFYYLPAVRSSSYEKIPG
jgi:hypothetical protein